MPLGVTHFSEPMLSADKAVKIDDRHASRLGRLDGERRGECRFADAALG